MTKSHGSKADFCHLEAGAADSFYLHFMSPQEKIIIGVPSMRGRGASNPDDTSSCATFEALVILFPRRRNYQSLKGWRVLHGGLA